ncbi:hypothetical protein OS493_031382 [Desmophyllum pertusum]|uniref:Phosphatidylinositol N-acetylglucosaminyltransferase subunit H conserved domain-containing protein n=1 Tax=Desmophyllum pertusum TaxID=174260 RepID=A0A9W9Y8T0_9CNID|nr:hypothetical protein OS493_031382 [Desmophyllum pertusum]
MNQQERFLDGSSIHGQKLKVYFKGDGVLSSSFVIERPTEPSFSLAIVCIFVSCFIAVVAVCQELLSLTNFLVWTVVLFAVVFLKLYCSNVHRESVLIVKDLGVQFTRSGVLGVETSKFIEQHKLVDVLINEVITMHQVVFYLTLLTCDGAQVISAMSRNTNPSTMACSKYLEHDGR